MYKPEEICRALDAGDLDGEIEDMAVIEMNRLRGEIERLREQSRRYYLADGTYLLMDTPEDVITARIEAARSIRDLQAELNRMRREMPPEHR